MKQIIQILTEEIRKLEEETEQIQHLDNKLNKRLKQNQRQSTLKETKLAIEAIEINAMNKATKELFIYAIPHQGKIRLNAKQTYSFELLTLQKIKLLITSKLEEGIKPFWNKTNRLTSYTEFKNRTEELIKKIEAGELDEYIGYSASELLYGLLGEEDKLLEQLGIDTTKSYTTNRLKQIIQNTRDSIGPIIER